MTGKTRLVPQLRKSKNIASRFLLLVIKPFFKYREYRANRDKRKQRIFSSENGKSELKTDSDRSFKPILYHQEKLKLNITLKVQKNIEKKPEFYDFHAISSKIL